jgi:beta-phosphoglucomutase-like phosphatase (HAD superfamily)
MTKLAHYLNAEESSGSLRELAEQLGVTEFAQVRNLDYVFSPWEIYPLAPRVIPPLDRIAAFAVDMDGTSTTTEPLALHALEYMVRRFTGRLTKQQWPGLDDRLDHPFVIGNSNFRHTEFLIQRYRDRFDHDAFRQAFFEAVAWTLANMTDPQRLRDITQDAGNCGLSELLRDDEFSRFVQSGGVNEENVARLVTPFVRRFGDAFQCDHQSEVVSAALDIYYMRYHAILRLIEQGQGDRLSHALLGESGRRLVEPMPGYDLFVPLVKGWLGPEIDGLYDMLRSEMLRRAELGHTAAELDRLRPRLARLAETFRHRPARLGLVTASIEYETHAVMKEVIHVMAQRVAAWPVSGECRQRVAERLHDYRAVYDGFVCASDACEPRLKPHRDLYSLALYRMSIPKAEYRNCVGIEDTEPGIISLRSAGIGCAIALPNRDTSRQDYQAAAKVIHGGLPELILVHNLLLAE